MPSEQSDSQHHQTSTDTKQNAQIERLGRKVLWAWITAAFGPVVALGSLCVTYLQWTASHDQLQIMRAQLEDARQAAREADVVIQRQLRIADSQAESLRSQAESLRREAASTAVVAETSRVMAEATKRNSINSERIAKSSESSIEAARDALRVDQRAWVGVDNYSVTALEIDKPFGIAVNLRNTGRTPATDVVMWSAVSPLPNGTVPNFERTRRLIQSGTLAPNAYVNHTFYLQRTEGDQPPALMSATDLERIRTREIVIWVFGGVTYQDIFGGRHWSNFCAYYSARREGMALCAQHNDMGDQ